MKLKIALAAASIATTALFATGAQANPVYIGYVAGGQGSGPITVAAKSDGQVNYNDPSLAGNWISLVLPLMVSLP